MSSELPRPEIDASYSVYDEHPMEEPDAWGDLASFREAAAAQAMHRVPRWGVEALLASEPPSLFESG